MPRAGPPPATSSSCAQVIRPPFMDTGRGHWRCITQRLQGVAAAIYVLGPPATAGTLRAFRVALTDLEQPGRSCASEPAPGSLFFPVDVLATPLSIVYLRMADGGGRWPPRAAAPTPAASSSCLRPDWLSVLGGESGHPAQHSPHFSRHRGGRPPPHSSSPRSPPHSSSHLRPWLALCF